MHKKSIDISHHNDSLPEMQPISLDHITRVKLMNRRDIKYLTTIGDLPLFLTRISDHYYIQEIDGKRTATYETVYYDTANYGFFLSHVNGKLNRCKVRIRSYVDSNLHFLEVKSKTNKNKTIKKRVKIDSMDLGPEIHDFVLKYAHADLSLLAPILKNRFERITLINKKMTERVTIDFELVFTKFGEEEFTPKNNLLIIEIKQDRTCVSPLEKVLKNMRIKKTGFSKYCIGMVLTGHDTKNNVLKKKLREIQKITDHEYVA